MQKSLACQEAEYHQTMAEPKRLRLDPEAEAAEGDGPGDENPLLPQIAKIDELQVQLDKVKEMGMAGMESWACLMWVKSPIAFQTRFWVCKEVHVDGRAGLLSTLQINDEASDRVLEVEREFNKKRRPVFKQRNEVIRAIPRFWSQALGHHPVIRGMMTEHDSDVLDFCTEVDDLGLDRRCYALQTRQPMLGHAATGLGTELGSRVPMMLGPSSFAFW
jgi:hypothetical protein